MSNTDPFKKLRFSLRYLWPWPILTVMFMSVSLFFVFGFEKLLIYLTFQYFWRWRHIMRFLQKRFIGNKWDIYIYLCLFATGQCFSPGPPTSSTNKTDRHDIAEIVSKVALSTTNQTKSNLYKADFVVFHVNLLYYTHCM